MMEGILEVCWGFFDRFKAENEFNRIILHFSTDFMEFSNFNFFYFSDASSVESSKHIWQGK